MSRNGIELSPKHGINATIPICFWCGKEKNEIAMLGRVRERDPRTGRVVPGSDLEVPMKMVLNYEPCDCCKEQFNQGVRIVEAVPDPGDTRPAISEDEHGNKMYPTGRLLVLTPEGARKIFTVNPSMLEAGKALCLDEETFNAVNNLFNDSQENFE